MTAKIVNRKFDKQMVPKNPGPGLLPVFGAGRAAGLSRLLHGRSARTLEKLIEDDIRGHETVVFDLSGQPHLKPVEARRRCCQLNEGRSQLNV